VLLEVDVGIIGDAYFDLEDRATFEREERRVRLADRITGVGSPNKRI
jgi:hypothetical protein